MKTFGWTTIHTITHHYEVKAKTRTEARHRQREFFHKGGTVVSEILEPNEVVVTATTDVKELIKE